ncbi:hypothetical protein PsYK624_148160 [Phanerochaete sordida]|uniref:Uncharacterized protein n=1 Tax=Phanerochaete sordida TaxID=48140 RepID=A0A9P3GML6_9APHY|nr:hypothetical protein PsYK624_148160 [Phanerochaete sordida]
MAVVYIQVATSRVRSQSQNGSDGLAFSFSSTIRRESWLNQSASELEAVTIRTQGRARRSSPEILVPSPRICRQKSQM